MAEAYSVISIVLYAGILIWAVCISAVRVPPPSSSGCMQEFTTSTDKSAAVNISTNIEEHLLSVQMSAVKSIQSSDGDTIDCIPPSKQLAFHHPSLKDHKLQEAPSTIPSYSSRPREAAKYNKLAQVWQLHGRCPSGTIPVRRVKIGNTPRTSSSSNSAPRRSGKSFNGSDPQIVNGVEHEHSVGYVTGSQVAYYGTQATFSLWAPYVETSGEFSLAQLWVMAIAPDNSINTLEAGWQVFPKKYGDNNPRLFVYWTSDSYNATGCYNLDCSGFVQTSSNVLVGGSTGLSPVSTINGSQVEITLLVFKDPTTGNWWLEYNGENVGYWPQNLSYLTTNYANGLEWGGEVINMAQQNGGQHTTTQMGSGNFAEAGYEEAAYIRNIQWVDGQNIIQNVSNLQTLAENVTCYNIIAGSDDVNWGTYFYFGGPGRNANCP